MADGIIFMLLERLVSTVYKYVDGEVKLVLNAKKDVEEFAGNLKAIQAVLEDAEQRQVKEANVRTWLDQLKDISFEMVDVLDEWNTDMLRQEVEKQEREGENVVPNKQKKKKNKAALQLGDLKVLNLEGRLNIRLKGNVKDESELEKAQLWHMNQLFHLNINSKDVFYKQRSSTVEILNVLRPHENMESLDISYHSGTTCPNWMMSLHNLRIITLKWWNNCEFLPPLGKLPYLEELNLLVMEVKKIGGEFLVDQDYSTLLKSSSSSSSFFPKLKQLEIRYMEALEEWEVGVEQWNKEDSEISIMPCLSFLTIHNCQRIKTLPDFLCKTPLQDLIIKDCPSLSKRCKQGSGEEWLKISHIPNIKIYE